MHRLHGGLQLLQLCGLHGCGQGVEQVAAVLAQEQQAFGLAVRVTQRDAHQKTVELRFGQRVRANLVKRVLRGDHKKRLGQGARFAFDADLLLLHGFEQGALRFGAGPVDLVGQQNLGEQGAGVEHKARLGRLVHRHARQVARHQVRGKLHPRKLQAQAFGQGVRQGGFAHAGHVLNQQVAARQHAGQRILQLPRLAHNHRAELRQNGFDGVLHFHI